MSAIALPAGTSPTRPALVGRTFLTPALDYALIGGGLSLLLVAWTWARPQEALPLLAPWLAPLFALTNGAHFAASTVRLYTRVGAQERWPFLTRGLPLASLAAVLLVLWSGPALGRHLVALYFTWSPFHYAAQAYGIAVMYSARSGCALDEGTRRALRIAALLPFLHSFLRSPLLGLFWVVPTTWMYRDPAAARTLTIVLQMLAVASWLAPVVVFAVFWARARRPLPLMAAMVLVANASWWTVLSRSPEGFAWAAVFHGVQYLAITLVFHARERTTGAGRSTVAFYVACVAGSWLLFQVWPRAFAALGFGAVESLIIVSAAVNLHHFIVDAYIWKLRGDSNARVVAAAA